MGEHAASAVGVALLLGVVVTACSSGDSVDLGPDSQADVVVCLNPGLTRDEARVFRETRLRGGLLRDAPIADYTAQGGDSVTLNWESSHATRTNGLRSCRCSVSNQTWPRLPRTQPSSTNVASDHRVITAGVTRAVGHYDTVPVRFEPTDERSG